MDLPTTTATPISTMATTSSAPALDSAHRSCSSCPRRMSKLKYDRHTVCSNCRSCKCDIAVRCNECKDWTIPEMEEYLKHRRSLEGKSKKKSVPQTTAPATTATTLATTSADSQSVSVSARESADIQNMMRMFIETYHENSQALTRSLPAPVSVPDSAPLYGGTLGVWRAT